MSVHTHYSNVTTSVLVVLQTDNSLFSSKASEKWLVIGFGEILVGFGFIKNYLLVMITKDPMIKHQGK